MTIARARFHLALLAAVPAASLAVTACGPSADAPSAAAITGPPITSDAERGWWTVEAIDRNGSASALDPAVPAPANATIRIRTDLLFFATDSAAVSDDGRRALEPVARQIIAAAAPVIVVGHTDDTGSGDHNLALGAQRADAVQQLLADLGVPDDLLTGTLSMGETCPLAANTDPDGRSRNRRVEVVPLQVSPADTGPTDTDEPTAPTAAACPSVATTTGGR